MRKPSYFLSLLSGVGIAIYIYVYAFDSFSEEELINLSLLWFVFINFGLNGLAAENLLKRVQSGDSPDLKSALISSSKSYGIFGTLGQIIFSPFLIIRNGGSLHIAIYSTIAWMVLFVLFLKCVFPML